MRTYVIALAVVAIDLATKTAAGAGILTAPWIESTTNADLALGIAGASAGTELALGFVTLLIGALALRRRRAGALGAVAAGFVIGGTLGNLADRLLLGEVRDFLVGPYIVFNVADVALVIGIVVFLLQTLATPFVHPASEPFDGGLRAA